MRRPAIAAASLCALLTNARSAAADDAPPPPAVLNFVTDNPATELQTVPGHGGGTLVCRGNCTQVVDRLWRFSIRGKGVAPSSTFKLPPGGPLFTVKVRTGSYLKHELTGMLAILGLPVLIAGSVVLSMGAENTGGVEPYGKNVKPVLLGVGISVMLLGAAGMMTGGLLNGRNLTRVTIDSGLPSAVVISE